MVALGSAGESLTEIRIGEVVFEFYNVRTPLQREYLWWMDGQPLSLYRKKFLDFVAKQTASTFKLGDTSWYEAVIENIPGETIIKIKHVY